MSDSNKPIVLNRMYAGSYLSTHLGHEVINMFQADNGKHYLYLNSNGVFDHKGFIAKDRVIAAGINALRRLKAVRAFFCKLRTPSFDTYLKPPHPHPVADGMKPWT